jgi:hypothetical protein
VAQLAMQAPAPGVDFAQGSLGDRMPETALETVDPFARLLKTSDEFWHVTWVDVS